MGFITVRDFRDLGDALAGGDVSSAWAAWSAAAETSLADAYQFAGGPVSQRGLRLGREATGFRSVQLGGHNLRSATARCSDPEDGGHVGPNRDASTAPLFDLRRSSQGFSALGRGVQLLWIFMDSVSGAGLQRFGEVVRGMHDCLNGLMRDVVVCRRDAAVRERRTSLLKDPLVRPHQRDRSDLTLPSPFLPFLQGDPVPQT